MITSFFFNILLSLLLVLLKQLELHLSGLTYWHICISLCRSYGLWQTLVSVLLPVSERNVSECESDTLERSAEL